MIHSLTLEVADATGVQGQLHVAFDRWDGDRPQFKYEVFLGRVVEEHPASEFDSRRDWSMIEKEVLISGDDLRLGSANDADHVEAMAALIDFLLSDAEKYREQSGRTTNTSAEALMHRTGDTYTTNELAAQWAYHVDDELAVIREELRAEGPVDACDYCDGTAADHESYCLVPGRQRQADELLALISAADSTHLPRLPIGGYRGWQVRWYPSGMVDAPEVRFDAIIVGDVGMAPGCDTLADLIEWIDGEEQRRPVEQTTGECACDAGLRERGQYGNVHPEDER